jgi:hypothetical protein
MSRLMAWVVGAMVGLAVLGAVGPSLVALAHAAVLLVVVIGVVLIFVRLAWHLTGRW